MTLYIIRQAAKITGKLGPMKQARKFITRNLTLFAQSV